jgi:uncharacterized membrane protein
MSAQGKSRDGNGDQKRTEPSSTTDVIADQFRQEIIPPALQTALRNVGVDPQDPNVSKALEISLTMMFSGSLPLAPPPILREYGNVRPELIDKLVEWTEQQSTHRRELERLRTEGSERRLNRAQWIGGAVAIGGLALASLVGNYSAATAIAIALAAVGGPTAAIWLAHTMGRSPLPTLPPSPPGPKPPGSQVS